MADTGRIEMRVSADLLARIDAARGELPRATWIKRALESALGRGDVGVPEVGGPGNSMNAGYSGPAAPASSPAPSRTPAPSSWAKAGVKPIPKGTR